MTSLHVLHSGTRMSFKDPFLNGFAEAELVAYVMVRASSGAKLIVTSWGHLGNDVEVGSTVFLIGGQSGRRMGAYYVAAIMDLGTRVKYKAKAWFWSDFRVKMKHYVVK